MPAPRSSSRDLALIATFAGVIAALGLVPAFTPPGFAVPITAQSLGVMLAGAVLGARRGFLSLLLLLVLVAVGLPLLAGGRGGLGVFATPSAGFLHRLAGRGVRHRLADRARRADVPAGLGAVANVVGGIVVLYALGIAGIAAGRPASRCRPPPCPRGSSSPATWSRWSSPPSSRAVCTRPTRASSLQRRGRPPRVEGARLSERAPDRRRGRATRSPRSSPRTPRGDLVALAHLGHVRARPGSVVRTTHVLGRPRSAPSPRSTGLTAASRGCGCPGR